MIKIIILNKILPIEPTIEKMTKDHVYLSFNIKKYAYISIYDIFMNLVCVYL